MSTHAMIGRFINGKYEGRYHHFDGYPTGLGKELFKLAKEWGRERLLKTLIDDHPAGWSSILEADWSRAPGYQNDPKCSNCGRKSYSHVGTLRSEGSFPPACYCHGDRQEDPSLLTDPDEMEWSYLFVNEGFPPLNLMNIRNYGKIVAVVNLEDAEPDWEAVEKLVYNS